jgi:hypothetical protein
MAALHKEKPELPLVSQAREYLAKQAISGSGFVYFVHAGMGRIKIGFSKNPLTRFGSLRTNCPDRLTLLGIIPGTKADEKAWHQRFSDLRLFGEWYRSTVTLREEIKRAKSRTLVRTLANRDSEVRQCA